MPVTANWVECLFSSVSLSFLRGCVSKFELDSMSNIDMKSEEIYKSHDHVVWDTESKAARETASSGVSTSNRHHVGFARPFNTEMTLKDHVWLKRSILPRKDGAVMCSKVRIISHPLGNRQETYGRKNLPSTSCTKEKHRRADGSEIELKWRIAEKEELQEGNDKPDVHKSYQIGT